MINLKNVKVIFIDIDRTLTDSQKRVTVENSKAIEKAVKYGIMVVLCSGRGVNYAINKSKEANASQYVIVNNGAQIYDYNLNKSLYENYIDKETVNYILEEFKKSNIECILNTSTTRFGTKNLQRKLSKGDYIFEGLDSILGQNVLQIVGETKSFEDMNKLVNIVDKCNELKILNLSKTFLENRKNEKSYYADIDNITVSKGQGIREFFRIFNIKKEESLCFGDYVNDKDMFEACGYRVAMGNASDELKEKADYVTLSNDKSGVAYFINNFIIN